MKQWNWVFALVAAFAMCGTASAQITYSVDDGTAENGVGITGAAPFDIVWLNQFPVQAGGEVITNVSVSFGSPTDVRVYNGLPISILIYQDPDGGATTNAVLLSSTPGVISGANTTPSTFVNFDVPDTAVVGNFLVGVLARNVPGNAGFIAAIDETDPDVAGRSFAGFTVGTPLNENNLASLGASYGSIEGFGLPGNWLVRADATAVPEPTSMTLMGLAVAGYGARRFKKKK